MASLTCVSVPTARIPQSQRQCCSASMQGTILRSHPRQSALVTGHSSYSRRPAPRTLHRVSCSAGDFEEGELIKGIKAGDKLKVKESRVVYHAPKHKVDPCCMLVSVMCFSVLKLHYVLCNTSASILQLHCILSLYIIGWLGHQRHGRYSCRSDRKVPREAAFSKFAVQDTVYDSKR